MLVELSPQLWGTGSQVPIGTSCSKEWFWHLPFTNLKLIYVFSSGILSTMVYTGFNFFLLSLKNEKNIFIIPIFLVNDGGVVAKHALAMLVSLKLCIPPYPHPSPDL